MRALVLGGGGMLGHKIAQVLYERGFEVECTIRDSALEYPLDRIKAFKRIRIHAGVEAMDLTALRTKLAEIKPDVVINCIGVIKQRALAQASVPSITLNALLPHLLSEWLEPTGGKVIHFSTDCVFSGDRGAYTVTDESDAKDLYGKSKFLGEVANTNALTLRTSIIGRELGHLSSLVEWFLAQKSGPIKGYTRAIYSGMTTATMADLVCTILEKEKQITGLEQVVSARISKFDLLLLLKEAFGKAIQIDPDDSVECDRSMIGSGFTESVGFTVPTWREQIFRMASDPTPYGDSR